MTDLSGLVPESWLCVDCGADTAPGVPNRIELGRTIASGVALDDAIDAATAKIDDRSEIFTVRNAVWRAAGMEPFGGCLCIGCLEERLARKLKAKDFPRD